MIDKLHYNALQINTTRYCGRHNVVAAYLKEVKENKEKLAAEREKALASMYEWFNLMLSEVGANPADSFKSFMGHITMTKKKKETLTMYRDMIYDAPYESLRSFNICKKRLGFVRAMDALRRSL